MADISTKQHRKPLLCTLVFVLRADSVLLGFKKRGFGAGNWNGFGGKVQAEEEPIKGAARELQEEAGISAQDLTPRGRLLFEFVDQPEFTIDVRVYTCTAFTGDITESEEMRPQWFHLHELPFDCMWADDRYWLPHLICGANVVLKGEFCNTTALLRLSYRLHRREELDFIHEEDWDLPYDQWQIQHSASLHRT